MKEMRNAYTNFSKTGHEGKRPLGRPVRKRGDNIRMVLRETGWEGVDCMYMAQDRSQWRALVNRVMNHRVP